MKTLRILVLAICASALPVLAGPNQTDLSTFKGNFSGRGQVEAGGSVYKGKDKIRGIVPGSGKTLKLKLKCDVKSNGQDVALDNEIRFTKSGAVKTNELLPGTPYRIKAKGRYSATPGLITFQGQWKYGTSKGTFSGTATVNDSGFLTLTYAVVLEDEEEPLYTYTYKGK